MRRCPIYALDGSPIDENLDKQVRPKVSGGRNYSPCSSVGPPLQIEKQFNDLLDSCGAFRTAIGASADIVSLGRAMEQLSSEHGIGTDSTAERALLDWHMANLECVRAARHRVNASN